MTFLYLIRHARTAWNNSLRMQGWHDEPLDDAGRAQAHALARRLSGERLSALYSSPLARARETAEIVAQAHGLAVRCDDRLRERNLGEWTGLTMEEAQARHPELDLRDDWRSHGPPGGENQATLAARVAEVMESVLQEHPLGAVAVVSHGGALSAYLAHLLGIPPERPVSFAFPNTGLARVSVRPARNGDGRDVRVLGLADDRHLGK
jgi:broad specificity phosphatase PhoE